MVEYKIACPHCKQLFVGEIVHVQDEFYTHMAASHRVQLRLLKDKAVRSHMLALLEVA